ncbi:hypothetical protein AB0M54_13180 [Actinoplanes sp. NPDC051470]|uniref:hypothetical protein n=1 Tax=Actinoplanes sp. NPDC051470 TaxID=3157224 RepID=UPI00341B3072
MERSVSAPRLTVRPRPGFWTHRLRIWFAVAASVGTLGLVVLLVTGNALLPFREPVLLRGKSGSAGDLFLDPTMQQILLKRHFRVEVTQTGSGETATGSFDGYNFLFPSGRPTASTIRSRLAERNISPKVTHPFASPLVLASFRQYAETLVAAGVARPQANRLGGPPMYYTLDTAKFLGLTEAGTTWDDLDLGSQKDADGGTVTNGNRVLAHTPNMCFANSGQTYLALAAWVIGGRNEPPREQDALRIAARIKPMLTLEGLQDADLFNSYRSPEGKGKAPIVVVYEHQYFAYQLDIVRDRAVPDTDRVPLYPAQQMLADPEFIPTNAKLAADLYGFVAEAERGVNQQVATKYVDNADPVAVIKIVMDVLEDKGDVIYVDLLDGVVEPDRTLRERVSSRGGGSLPFAELARPGAYVSVWGSFDLFERTGEHVLFAASPPGGDKAARVVFRCPIGEISTEDMLAGPFMARCLGRVRSWDSTDRELSIRPVAVFN